jgi:cytochrome b
VSEAASAPPAAADPAATPAPERVRIWDWPTRAFHWLLVLLIAAMWWTAEYDRIELHAILGIVTAGLLLFRLLWGFLGSSTARFSNFLKGPRGVLSYLNGRSAHALGHNPLGGWSVAAMLALLTTQVTLGLFASDEDGDVIGPLSLWIEEDTVEWVTETHEWLFNGVLALIALHVAAILVYALKRRNLVGPMLSGSGTAPQGTAPMRTAPAWRLLLASLLSASFALWLWSRL